MSKLWVSLLCAALAVAAFAPAALADYRSDYKAYNAALAAGDTKAAGEHALAAWKAAEAELGDDKVTAMLAYNYGQHVLFADPAAALPALKRAKELVAKGLGGGIPVHDLDVYLAFAEFKEEGGNAVDAKAMRDALERRDASGAVPSIESAAIRLALAQHYLGAERYGDAEDAAQKAQADVLAAAPGDKQSLAIALMYAGVAKLVPYPRKIARIEAAHSDFTRAAALFPPQKDIFSVNPVLAQIAAWDGAASSALRSDAQRSSAKKAGEKWGEQSVEILFEGRPTDCTLTWEKREPPKYPSKPLNEGSLGAALVGYNLGPDGKVIDQRTLAEVPGSSDFGSAALRSTASWRASGADSLDPACRQNLTTVFIFSFRPY